MKNCSEFAPQNTSVVQLYIAERRRGDFYDIFFCTAGTRLYNHTVYLCQRPASELGHAVRGRRAIGFAVYKKMYRGNG